MSSIFRWASTSHGSALSSWAWGSQLQFRDPLDLEPIHGSVHKERRKAHQLSESSLFSLTTLLFQLAEESGKLGRVVEGSFGESRLVLNDNQPRSRGPQIKRNGTNRKTNVNKNSLNYQSEGLNFLHLPSPNAALSQHPKATADELLLPDLRGPGHPLLLPPPVQSVFCWLSQAGYRLQRSRVRSLSFGRLRAARRCGAEPRHPRATRAPRRPTRVKTRGQATVEGKENGERRFRWQSRVSSRGFLGEVTRFGIRTRHKRGLR